MFISGIRVGFSLRTLIVIVALASVLLAIVAHERNLLKTERSVIIGLQRQPYLRVGTTRSTCFDVDRGFFNLILYTIRRHFGVRTVYSVEISLDKGQAIPGDLLNRCSDLQRVAIRVDPDDKLDWSELTRIPTIRQLRISGPCPDDLTPLLEMESLESIDLNLIPDYRGTSYPNGRLSAHLEANAVGLGKVKWLYTFRKHPVLTAFLRDRLPGCKILQYDIPE